MSRFSENTLRILEAAGWFPGRHVSTDDFEAYVRQENADCETEYELAPNDTIRNFLREFGGLTLTMHRTIPWVRANSFKDSVHTIPIGIPGIKISVFVDDEEKLLDGDKLYPISNDDDMLWYFMSYSGKVYGRCGVTRFVEIGKDADSWIENICNAYSGIPCTPQIVIRE